MTRDEAMRRAQQALGCQKVLIAKPQCDLHAHGLGDCTPERHCGCLTMTPERIVGAAIEDETLTRTGRSLGDLASEHVAAAALDAVRGALASSDPEMATRLGLVRIAGPGSNGRTWETYGTPWQEVPDGDA